MDAEVERRFIKKRVDDMRTASAIRTAGVKAAHVYVLRERIDCSHWEHVAEYFIKPTPRTYVTLQPGKVVRAMKKQGLW